MRKEQPTTVAFPATVIVDTREQTPFTFLGLRASAKEGRRPLIVNTERGTLQSADYSLATFERVVGVERKSWADLLGSLGHGRERFERELQRLNEYAVAAVVVEADWRAITGYYPNAMLRLLAHVKGKMASTVNNEVDGVPQCEWNAYHDALLAMMPEPPRSKFSPRSVFASITAWEQRYQRVHWHLMPDRRFAEVKTFKILERFLRDHPPGGGNLEVIDDDDANGSVDVTALVE